MPQISEVKTCDIDVECAVALVAPVLSVESVTTSSVTLSWTDPNSAETGYAIERSLTAINNFILIGNVDENETEFVDTDVTGGVTYFYRVKATSGLAVYSNVVSQEVPLLISMTWNSANTSAGSTAVLHVKLPLEASGTYDFNVDWGDGNSDQITAFDQAEVDHTYAADATYTIEIFGTINGFRFNNTGDRLKLLTIDDWGTLLLGNSNGYFYGCSNLTITAIDIPNITGITNFQSGFRGCSSIITIPGIQSWDVGEVVIMSQLFHSCTLFNSNIGAWNTVSVTAMDNMFVNAAAFNQDIGNWNLSAVVGGLVQMFDGCTVFNQDLDSWDVSGVTSTSFMFRNCAAFNQPLNSWNTAAITAIVQMFNGCTAFNQNIDSWDMSACTSMTDVFLNATSFNQSLNSWVVTAVTTMAGMFSGATAFNSDITGWGVTSATILSNMFFGATAFNQNISTWNVATVTTFNSMFSGATAFNQNISGWTTTAATEFISMFSGATAFDQDIGGWDVTGVTDMTTMFFGVTLSTANYDALLVGFEGQAVQDNVSLGGGDSTYTDPGAPATARAALIADHTWTITDGGAA